MERRIIARLLRAYMWLKSLFCRVDVACISNYRDQHDCVNFGFKDGGAVPRVLPWIMFNWNGIRGRLYMIGSTAKQVAGDTATTESKVIARMQFLEAVGEAVNVGAKVILSAASTKRLFNPGELKGFFPKTIFTIGDNFTSLLLWERIVEVLNLIEASTKRPRILVLAPYGHLGKFVVHCLTTMKADCEIIGMGRSLRLKNLDNIAGFKLVNSFEDVGEVDMVIACHHADIFQLTINRVQKIIRQGQKLFVIDPCEPANMPPELYEQSKDLVIRLDAGNGYSPELKYTGGKLAYDLLRLDKGVIWGCFYESLLIAKYLQNVEVDWSIVSPQNMALLKNFYGKGKGQITLPYPTCFNEPIEIATKKTQKQEDQIKNPKHIRKWKFADVMRILF